MNDVHIEEEDSVALSKRAFSAQQGKVNVAVVLLRYHIQLHRLRAPRAR